MKGTAVSYTVWLGDMAETYNLRFFHTKLDL